MTRVLGVDPGDVHIGLALSDPLGIIASPFTVLKHLSRREDALAILRVACEHDVDTIVVGVPYMEGGRAGPQARKCLRLKDALQSLSDLTVLAWDESGSTQAAMRGAEKDALIDARAAAYLLQEYLNAQAH